MRDVSVIVPVYNQLPTVLKLGASLVRFNQQHLKEVIMVDDCSPEFDLREIMGPPFSVLRNSTNVGFCKTENIGGQMARGKHLMFLNSDIEVHSQWLDPAVKLLEDNEKIGVVGIKLVFPPNEKGEFLIQSCGGLYDANHMPFHRYIGWLAHDRRVNKAEKISWTTGAALLTRKELFDKVGGMDESYGRGYFDDPDYCEKIKALGYEVWYCPEASATHRAGTTMQSAVKTEQQKRESAKSFYNNARLFESKWFEKITPDVDYIAVNF